MNRHERRRREKFVTDYVEHLDQVPFGVLERGRVYHSVYYHDDWCGIFKGGICTCSPTVKRYVEPQRQ